MRTSTTAAIGAAFILATSAAHASLTLVDGGLGVYDSVNNVTWTSDANLFGTQYTNSNGAVVQAILANWSGGTAFGNSTHTLSSDDFLSSGRMDWFGALAWVSYLNATNYGGSHQ
jgi:hypothetical protein